VDGERDSGRDAQQEQGERRERRLGPDRKDTLQHLELLGGSPIRDNTVGTGAARLPSSEQESSPRQAPMRKTAIHVP
jgi:hypothetical protein